MRTRALPGKTPPRNQARTPHALFEALLSAYGPQGWWPARSAFEMMLGAILTQRTAWRNAEQALERLRSHRALHPRGFERLSARTLLASIRPAGFWRVKSRRLRHFARFYRREFGSNPKRLQSAEGPSLRRALLAVKGIGPETADCILVYAAGKPAFIADAYARRILTRTRVLDCRGRTYEEIRRAMEERFPKRAPLCGEFHALLVEHAKRFCRPEPLCGHCPLQKSCPRARHTAPERALRN